MFKVLKNVAGTVFVMTAVACLAALGFFVWLGIMLVYPVVKTFKRKKTHDARRV